MRESSDNNEIINDAKIQKGGENFHLQTISVPAHLSKSDEVLNIAPEDVISKINSYIKGRNYITYENSLESSYGIMYLVISNLPEEEKERIGGFPSFPARSFL